MSPDINLGSISPGDPVSTARGRISDGTHPDFQADSGTADPLSLGVSAGYFSVLAQEVKPMPQILDEQLRLRP